MAIIFKKRIIREDPSVDFYRSPDEFYSYIQQNYINTGKIITFRNEEYIDSLGHIIEYETMYRDQASFDEAVADLEFKKDAEHLTNYCFDNLIRLVSIQINNTIKSIECDPERTVPIDVQSLTS
jgi:hypothetical protein